MKMDCSPPNKGENELGSVFETVGHVSNGSTLHCFYTDVSIRSLPMEKDRGASAFPEHTLQKGLLHNS